MRKKMIITLLVVPLLLGGLQLQAQSLLSKRISLTLKDVPITTFLSEIKKQTGCEFVYDADDLKNTTPVSIDVKNADIVSVLTDAIHLQGIHFVINGNMIVLKRQDTHLHVVPVKQIRGTVLDEQSYPLPGVSVVIKGTQKGISTDVNGVFMLTVPANETPTLIFSFIGMKTQEVPVTTDRELKVVLRENVNELPEFVATGMQIIKQERMTGSASVITAKDLRDQGITSIDRILDGRVAGLSSTTVSGAPGMRAKITIRGENNLSGNSEPLWILDGLPLQQGVPVNNSGNYTATIMQDGVGNIMPEDIESISVLKDAAAAAIYGARAANGVIVITTKKGFRSKTQVSYTGNFDIGMAPRANLGMMNSAEKLQYERSILDYYGLDYADIVGRGSLFRTFKNGYMTQAEYDAEMQRLSGINTDWFGEIFRTSISQMHSINIRGGSEELSYYTSVNIQNKNGILQSNNYQNGGILLNLDYRPIKKLTFQLGIRGNTRKNRDHASAINPFNYAVFANPYERPYNDDGSYASDWSYLNNNRTTLTSSGLLYSNFNMLREMRENRLTETGLDGGIRLNARYEPLHGLALQAIMSRDINYNYSSREINAGTYTSWAAETFARKVYAGQPFLPAQYDNGELGESSGRANAWSVRGQIDYSFSLKQHLFSVLGAVEASSRKFNNFGYTSPVYFSDYRITGLPLFSDPSLPYSQLYDNLKNAYTTKDGQARTLSYIGQARYGFEDKYIADFNIRADGADVIGKGNRFQPLWSVGVRYNVHNEKFFKNNFIDELSLRASYGFTGQIDRSAYPFSIIEISDILYMGNRVVRDYVYPNPTVRWERKQDRNLGIFVSFLKRRVNFTGDLYSNRTDDILTNLNIPVSTGRESVYANGGSVANKGIELSLAVHWLDRSDLKFSTSANIAFNSNKVLRSLYDYQSYKELSAGVLRGGPINVVGQETGGIYGWKTAGINPETGAPRYYLSEDGKQKYLEFIQDFHLLPQDWQDAYKEVLPSVTEVPDIVDVVDPNLSLTGIDWERLSIQYLGRSNPKYVGGFGTYLKYKNIEFTTSWVFKGGHLVPAFNDLQNAPRNASRLAAGYSSDLAVSATNREKKYLYYWQVPGDITDVRRFETGVNDYWASKMTDIKYERGDYLRLNNVSLSYRFPQTLAKQLKLTNLLIGVNVRNLVTFTRYRGLDVASGGAFTYPVAKEFNVKLSLGI